jgi:hypothetical protein
MKDIFRNSILYYIAAPVLIALWPALVTALYLPDARSKLDVDMSDYNQANEIMLDILTLAPERTETADPNKEQVQFQYYQVVPNIASLCSIPPEKYKLNTGRTIDAKTGKTQSASVRFTNIDITSFAKFLSMIQAHWPKLACNSVTLNKKSGSPDEWEILTDFKYYYSASD